MGDGTLVAHQTVSYVPGWSPATKAESPSPVASPPSPSHPKRILIKFGHETILAIGWPQKGARGLSCPPKNTKKNNSGQDSREKADSLSGIFFFIRKSNIDHEEIYTIRQEFFKSARNIKSGSNIWNLEE
jgi:hypothetical protein